MKFLRIRTIVKLQKRCINVLKSSLGEIKIPNKSIPQYVFENSHCWANKPAFTCGVTGTTYNYGEMKRRTMNFSRSLIQKVGMKQGEVIALILPNMPEYPIALHGAMEAGLTVTSVNPVYTEEEVKRQFTNAGAVSIVTIPKFKEIADNVGNELSGYKGTITIGEGGKWNLLELSDPSQKLEPLSGHPSPSDLALLPYSSGTTGLPKGVMLTHSNIVANMQQIMHPTILNVYPTTESHQEISLGVLPFFHIYGCTGIMCVSLRLGIHVITLPHFSPDTYINCLEKYKPTLLFVVPSLLTFLTKHPGIKPEHFLSVKTVMSGAAPATKTLIDLFKEKAQNPNIIVQQGYGMTESSPCTLITPQQCPESKAGSSGILLANTEAKVVSMETGENLPPNQSGELYLRGPQVMSGYLKNEAATRETLDSEKWLHTGDVAHYDEDGYFYITNRTKELIKVKGNQVSPTELESILMTMPGIQDVAVIGVPDEKSGELPRAFVVRYSGSKLTETEVQQFIEPQVAPYKKLAGGVQFIESIPKNAAGKILRHELQALTKN